eukprot:6200129-Pleurochrysis_carterae.AAC.1
MLAHHARCVPGAASEEQLLRDCLAAARELLKLKSVKRTQPPAKPATEACSEAPHDDGVFAVNQLSADRAGVTGETTACSAMADGRRLPQLLQQLLHAFAMCTVAGSLAPSDFWVRSQRSEDAPHALACTMSPRSRSVVVLGLTLASQSVGQVAISVY